MLAFTRKPGPAQASINMGGFSIALLSAAGFGAVLFTLIAGFFLYSNTQSLVTAKDWVEHTQEVLTGLQTASQLADRIEFSTRLYALNKDESQLSIARYSAISLKVAALHIHTLVVDSSVQTRNAEQLIGCGNRLNRFVRDTVQAVPIGDLLACREAVSVMSEQERSFLKERTRKSQHSSIVSFSTECVFIGVSLLTLVGLFGILLRDAIHRRAVARQTAATNADLARSVQALETRIHESRLLTACRDELQLCTTVQQVFRAAANCMARLLPASTGSLAMISNSRNLVEVVSSWGADKDAILSTTESFSPESCCGLRLGQIRWRCPEISEIDCGHFTGEPPERYLCLPMMAQSETLGVLTIECTAEEAYAGIQEHMDGVVQLLQLTGMTIASLNLRVKLENQSIRDALTGLFNRHFMQITLNRELSRAARTGAPVALFMLDVDHFKRFNDTFGHGAGDTMLRAIANAFRASVRTEDTVCRYGGEEFAIILPGMTTEAALASAERIRRKVAELGVPLEDAPNGQTTVSIGIALYPDDGTEADALLRKADQALYRAKHNGRNQVWLAEELARV